MKRRIALEILAVVLIAALWAGSVQAQQTFMRGDADGDGQITMSDMIAIAVWQYANGAPGGEALTCFDAADVNDDGNLNVSDAIAVTGYLFGSYVIPAPFPAAGVDPTADGLDCAYYDSTADPAAVNPRMIIHDGTVLERAGLDFATVMKQIAVTSGDPNPNPLALYRQWWGDLGGNGCPATLNGFPNLCNRPEMALGGTDPFTGAGPGNDESYIPVAAINRFDRATAPYDSCGSFSLLYAIRSGLDDVAFRNLIIFEADVPNPAPQMGRAGCADLYEAWNDLDCPAADQPRLLGEIFLRGAGSVPPAVDFAHYRKGIGEIRTSTFWGGTQGTWAFRSFKTDLGRAGEARIEQVPVTGSTHLPALNDPMIAPGIEQAVIDAVSPTGLAAPAFTGLSLETLGDPAYHGAISEAELQGAASAWQWVSGGVQGPRNQGLIDDVDQVAQPFGLDAENIFDRVTALTCAGCHTLPIVQDDLGGGMARPLPNQFQHINEYGVLSPALRTVFLPARRALWDAVIGTGTCP
ncbi:hypothetical protein ABI59_11405 [Acidobacteria bacterium Mor1]|nr:hypothetical protein ABI59_11405 [Acidobacteria bacterium Mor1]